MGHYEKIPGFLDDHTLYITEFFGDYFAWKRIVNFTNKFGKSTCLLIIFSGIGYIVWWDVLRVLKEKRSKKMKFWQSLTLHSKIAISTTAFLIIFGGSLILLFEYNNPNTMQSYSLFEKIEVALFQSVTTRTAGFATIPQENLTNASAIVCLLLMFISTILLSAVTNADALDIFMRRSVRQQQ